MHPCPECGRVREARPTSLCRACRNTGRTSEGYGPTPIDHVMRLLIREAVNELKGRAT